MLAAITAGCDKRPAIVEYLNPNSQAQTVDSEASKGFEEISYTRLVDMIKENGGRLEIPVYATRVAIEKHGILDQKYAFGWTDRMRGKVKGLQLTLVTTETEKEKFGILDLSHGYATERTMHAELSGNEFTLSSTQKEAEHHGILDLKYSMAFSREMTGKLGEDIKATLISKGKETTGGILDQKWGYSWIDSGTLTLTLENKNN